MNSSLTSIIDKLRCALDRISKRLRTGPGRLPVDGCVPRHGGSEFEVRMWPVSEFILKKLVPVIGIHPFPLNELSLMVAAVNWIWPSHIFEWGTNLGVSARIFAETVRYFSLHTEIHSIDLPDDRWHAEHPSKSRGKLVRDMKEVQLHQGDGAEVSLDLWNNAGHKGTPFFFLDGDHSYESVKRELDLVHSEIDNACFLVHDTFYQTPEARYNLGPCLAIRDFLREEHSTFQRIDSHLGLPGMTLLYRRLSVK